MAERLEHRTIAAWRVAWKLAYRQVQRASIWMNLLIIVIMILTFLNLVVVTGILVGLLEGSLQAFRDQYSGDILITEEFGSNGIDNTSEILQTLESSPFVDNYSERYIRSAVVEANYQTRWDFNETENSLSFSLTGIHPVAEDTTTHLSDYLIEGEYLDPDESGYILIGTLNLAQYSEFSDIFDPLENVEIGSRVKITYTSTDGGSTPTRLDQSAGGFGPSLVDRSARSREFIVKGIVDSKVDQNALRGFVTIDDWNNLINPSLDRASEISINLVPGASEDDYTAELKEYGFDKYAKVQTWAEAIPNVLNDLIITFSLLGNITGSIAVIVSAITVFVVIYINALTRRKHIGILKGIGIQREAIERAYVMQSLFYAVVGGVIGFLLIFFVLVPYFDENPIDFPFSDGILAVTVMGTSIRFLILVGVTAIAGFIPAWLIVKKNTLDSILGR